MRLMIVLGLAVIGVSLAYSPPSEASDGELCWVRINQETIYGQKQDGLCRFSEIRILGEKLKEGRPYRPDIAEYRERLRQEELAKQAVKLTEEATVQTVQ